MKVLHHYDPNSHHSLSSANIIIDYMLNRFSFNPLSVIDVGCGLGQWLNVFQKMCTASIRGIDGRHVPAQDSFISEVYRVRTDIEEYIYLAASEKYDLALCLEVAEHLDKVHSSQLIQKLTSLSDNILFSAAIPGQTGENHVNEQPHRFWLDKFEERGYTVLDPFRKVFWNDSRVNWWYSQNLFLLSKSPVFLEHKQIYKYDNNMYIHPSLLDLHRPAKTMQVAEVRISFKSKLRSLANLIRR